MSERYVTVSTTYKRSTAKAILIDDASAGEVWLPRSCLAWKTDNSVDDWLSGDEVEIECFEWVAKKHGLL